MKTTGDYFDELTAGVREIDPATLCIWEGLSTKPVKHGKDVESVFRLREAESEIARSLLFADWYY